MAAQARADKLDSHMAVGASRGKKAVTEMQTNLVEFYWQVSQVRGEEGVGKTKIEWRIGLVSVWKETGSAGDCANTII